VSGASGAAALLDIQPTTLYSRIKALKIDREAIKS
jgi:DNA-binding NtrC family response regulator